MDRHNLWRHVAHDFQTALDRAPDGFHPVVLVILKGRNEPLRLGFVETRRDPEFPWVRFEVSRGLKPGEEDGGPIPSDAFWVWAHEDDVERVEVHYNQDPAFDFFNWNVLDHDEP
jgi:hypothetical protein